MAPRDDCVFCKIVSRGIPASVVFENEWVLAFLDVNPLAVGHVLLIPRDHFERLSELPTGLAGQLATAIPHLGRALLSVTNTEGYNLLVNEGTVAGQVVPHVHYHFIPRQSKDGLGYRWNAGSYGPGRADEVAVAYRKALPGL